MNGLESLESLTSHRIPWRWFRYGKHVFVTLGGEQWIEQMFTTTVADFDRDVPGFCFQFLERWYCEPSPRYYDVAFGFRAIRGYLEYVSVSFEPVF